MYKGGRMRWFRAPMAPVLFLLAPAALAAQGATVRGRVADKAGAPLAHAEVTIDGTLLRASTSATGEYTITGVPSGTRTVRARLLGYVQATAQVTVAGGQTVDQSFALQAQAIGLAPIDVVVGSHARHTAAEELAVPVDVYSSAELARQGTTETSQILQAVAPPVNLPHQSVPRATDRQRPVTLRGLSPGPTLVVGDGRRPA